MKAKSAMNEELDFVVVTFDVSVGEVPIGEEPEDALNMLAHGVGEATQRLDARQCHQLKG